MTTHKQNKIALAIMLLLILFSAAFHAVRAQATQTPIEECASALASKTNPRLMSRTTAVRKARVICKDIKATDSYFFKALTQ